MYIYILYIEMCVCVCDTITSQQGDLVFNCVPPGSAQSAVRCSRKDPGCVNVCLSCAVNALGHRGTPRAQLANELSSLHAAPNGGQLEDVGS